MQLPLFIPRNEVPNGSEILQVVLTGLSVVFIGLIILIIFVWAFGKIFSVAAPKQTPSKPTPAQAFTPPAPAAPAASSDNDEVIAVISAAVAAISAEEGKSYKIQSIAPAVQSSGGYSQWSAAGLLESTRPF